MYQSRYILKENLSFNGVSVSTAWHRILQGQQKDIIKFAAATLNNNDEESQTKQSF